MKKTLGIILFILIFIGLITSTIIIDGIKIALLGWGISLGLILLVTLAVWLISD